MINFLLHSKQSSTDHGGFCDSKNQKASIGCASSSISLSFPQFPKERKKLSHYMRELFSERNIDQLKCKKVRA